MGSNRSHRIGVADQGQQLLVGGWDPNGSEGVIDHEEGNYIRTTGRKRNKSFHRPQMEVRKNPFIEHKSNNKESLTQDVEGRVTKNLFQNCEQRKARLGVSFERSFTFHSRSE
jgi:hypothetical protein